MKLCFIKPIQTIGEQNLLEKNVISNNVLQTLEKAATYLQQFWKFSDLLIGLVGIEIELHLFWFWLCWHKNFDIAVSHTQNPSAILDITRNFRGS